MVSPSTMRHYLTVYRNAKTSLSRPASLKLNQRILQHDIMLQLISIFIIVMECLIIPATLMLPGRFMVGTSSLILMHLGIFFVMSKQVGVVFCTTLPMYLIGFSCTASVGTGPWWCALAVSLLPTLGSLLLRGELLPENWPSSSLSLFMWSGEQAKVLSDTLMILDTRVVLCTADKTGNNVVGLPVIHHGAVLPALKTGSANAAVHDCVLRVIGFTILQGDLKDVSPKIGCKGADDWNMNKFLQRLQTFLESEKRLFETQSASILVKAMLVRIDIKSGIVLEVLQDGNGAEQ